ncbi:hypothetical protein RVBP16_1580 [Pseudomonas phage sp. 30-2]|nr:hypothetical protein RVBP16_1580 [Pseudomonas phage sp. 30-2]
MNRRSYDPDLFKQIEEDVDCYVFKHEMFKDIYLFMDGWGQSHRTNGPALIIPNVCEVWYNHGKIHRDNGPAFFEITKDNEVRYCWVLDNNIISCKEQYDNVLGTEAYGAWVEATLINHPNFLVFNTNYITHDYVSTAKNKYMLGATDMKEDNTKWAQLGSQHDIYKNFKPIWMSEEEWINS